MTTILFTFCFILLLAHTLVGSLHDAPNAIAVPVRLRALTPRIAVGLSAFFNLLGLGLSLVIFSLLHDSWVLIPEGNIGLGFLAATLLTTVLWELLTWWRGLPSSATHALLGGLLGCVWASRRVNTGDFTHLYGEILGAVWAPLVLGPVVAFGLSWLLVTPLLRLLRHETPGRVYRRSGYMLSLGLSVTSLGHGMYFGHRALVLMVLMFLTVGVAPGSAGMWCAGLAITICLVLGTLSGGWRIGHTFASRMVKLDRFRGAIAQVTTSLLTFTTGALASEPYSSSHLAASATLGAGSHQRFNAVHFRTVARIISVWVLTIPVCAVLAAIFYLAVSPIL